MKWVYGLTGTVILGGCILYIWLGILLNNGVSPTAKGQHQYAILLGAKVNEDGQPSLSLQYRIDAAVAYLKQYPHVKVIVSGGQGTDEPMTEAALMYTYLVEADIEEGRIIMEDQSTSTYENLLFSKKLLPKGEIAVTVISSDFHLARTKYIAEQLGLQVDVVAANTPKIVEYQLRFRERLALIKTMIIGK